MPKIKDFKPIKYRAWNIAPLLDKTNNLNSNKSKKIYDRLSDKLSDKSKKIDNRLSDKLGDKSKK